MIGPRRFVRLLRINWVLVRNSLDEILIAAPPLKPVRYIKYLLPWYWIPRQRQPRARRLHQALEELGPLFVKFGQILSTRRDLLPDDIADELARLQDQVKPFPGIQARRTIEAVLGKPVEELFLEFSEQPLASASIAQVHGARLHDGREIIIKVVRPGIEKIIRRDLQLLYLLADLVQRYWPEGRRLRPREVVAEYEKTLLDELDFLREAANASQLRRNFDHPASPLYVPQVYWDLCRRDVMVMERIHGVPISDIKALKEKNIDLKTLAENGVKIFFTQVFRDSFFHADMHPGNIFVSDEGQYIAVDFGIMGSLGEEDLNYLAENFLAFFNRDYRRVAKLHIESGWVPRQTRVEEFEAAIRTVCEPIFQKPLKDISFGQVLLRLFQTARRFHMEVQPQLVLLQKTLLNIEGLGRQLYPELDLWDTAKPFLEKWFKERRGPAAYARQLADQLPKWMQILPQLPEFIQNQMRDSRSRQQPATRVTVQAGQARLVHAVLCAGLMIATAITASFHLSWITWALTGVVVVYGAGILLGAAS